MYQATELMSCDLYNNGIYFHTTNLKETIYFDNLVQILRVSQ